MTRAVTRSIAAISSAALLLAGALTLAESHASAATTPPWEASSVKDVNETGTLALYNSAGKQVISGSVLSKPMALYMVGSRADTTHKLATAYFATPTLGLNASAWPNEQASSSTAYPVKGAPKVVSGSKAPVVTGHKTDESIAQYIDDFPNTDTKHAGYVNAYQLRVKTSTNGTYQSLDFVVKNLKKSASGAITGGTWTETYPGLRKATKTSLASSKKVAKKGAAVTLTARVTASGAHPTGKVEFTDNGRKFGVLHSVPASGRVVLKTKKLHVGKNVMRAVYVPNTSNYVRSVSPAKKIVVKKK